MSRVTEKAKPKRCRGTVPELPFASVHAQTAAANFGYLAAQEREETRQYPVTCSLSLPWVGGRDHETQQ